MIDIKLDKRNVFAFNAKDISIGIFQHKDGKHTGPTRHVGNIFFASIRQAEQFAEMIELMVEKDQGEQV